MKDLHFKIESQRLTKDSILDFDHIVAGSKGYLRCIFSFDDDWTGAEIFAQFSKDRTKNSEEFVKVTNVSCMVPDSVTDGYKFHMRLIGKRGKTTIVTNWTMIEQER